MLIFIILLGVRGTKKYSIKKNLPDILKDGKKLKKIKEIKDENKLITFCEK